MEYDLAIIGAGWAGFNAAIKAKELGLKVAIIENLELGGTCLNRGCIPTKALIQSAKIFSLTKKSKQFGIETCEPVINFTQIQARKEKIVQELAQGIEFRLKGVDLIKGEARILSANTIKVLDEQLEAKYILIATGSMPAELKSLKFDGKKIISSDQILALTKVPQSLLIIGAGVIGCEFASLFNTLGTEVTLVEKMPQILPGVDSEIARKLEGIFKKANIKVNTNADALKFDFNAYELVLLSVGRVPQTDNLGLREAGVNLENGKIKVDEYLRTNIHNIFAAGDCTGQIMLAHFASFQGCLATENIAHPDKLKKSDNQNIPNCIFTHPQIGTVGLSEVQAKAQGVDINIKKFDFMGSGMARILDEKDGFIKIIFDNKTGRLLGASIIGPQATELIAILGVAVTNSLTIDQVKNTIFAHPTLSESIHEAL